MKHLIIFLFLMLANFSVQANCSQLLNIEVRALAGQEKINLCETYADKVVLIVNTASKCGFTPQYDGLEALYEKYKHRGLVILGFPSNDFGQQEPGSEKQIADFCRLTYGVKFPMFEKTQVRKHHADELYQRLGKAAGEFPQWNFHKYLLNRRGELVKSFNSKITPQDVKLIEEIETLL